MWKCSSVRNIWVSVLRILSVSPGNTDEKIELNQTQKFENEIFWPIKKYYLIFSLKKLTKQSDDDYVVILSSLFPAHPIFLNLREANQ